MQRGSAQKLSNPNSGRKLIRAGPCSSRFFKGFILYLTARKKDASLPRVPSIVPGEVLAPFSNCHFSKCRIFITVTSTEEKPPYAPRPQPTNATRSRRFFTLLAIKLLKRFRKRDGTVLFLSDKICVKYGPSTSLSEALTMQFVAKNTSIPVPQVYCAFTHQNRAYIVMERINGKPVGVEWCKRSRESRATILEQLKKMAEEMRRIRPPEGIGVAHVDGGHLHDRRLPGTRSYFDPFATIQDFHRYLRGGLEANPEHTPDIRELISRQDGQWSTPVFTHGDLSSLNILASGNKVVGIIDWETAGWYPSYWEYTTAWNVNPQNQFWRDEVDKFLQPMTDELEMERIRLKYFGDV